MLTSPREVDSGQEEKVTGQVNVQFIIYLKIFLFSMLLLPEFDYAFSSDSLTTSYQRGLNTDQWTLGFHYQKILANMYGLRISEMIRSSRLVVVGNEDKWKDEHRFNLDFSRFINSNLAAHLFGSSLFFSDKQTGYYVNDIQTHMLGLGMTYQSNMIRVPLRIGVKEDQRFGKMDRGVTYKCDFNAPHFQFGEYTNRFYGNFEEDDFFGRKNTTFGISYLVDRKFYNETSDTLRLGLTRQRRDYYISQEGDIESRVESGENVENVLSYQFSPDVYLYVRGALSGRQLWIHLISGDDRETKRHRKDFNTRGQLHLLWKKSAFWGNIAFLYRSEDQRYDLSDQTTTSPFSGSSFLMTPDNKRIYTILQVRSGWRFSYSDSLTFHSTLQRFRYDTPDPSNFDDRDEFRFRVDIQEYHRFSSDFSLRVALNLNFIHFVYIYGEKSADNNWTRILRLTPKVTWQPSSKWRFSQSAEILANYVDYDYETLLPGIRSFLYRKYRLEDSTWVALTSRTKIHLHYRLELDENGKFLWDQWLEQKLVDRQSHTFTILLDYHLWSHFHFGPGYFYFKRRGYRYLSEESDSQSKEISIDFRNHGPIIKVDYKSEHIRFSLRGSRFATRTHLGTNQVLTRIDLNMSWLL